MDMKSYLRQASSAERERLAASVKSSVGYFYLIAGGHRRPGTALCRALVTAEPKLTLHSLRPDVWLAPGGEGDPVGACDQDDAPALPRPHRRKDDLAAGPP
jgi:hypothetical protein